MEWQFGLFEHLRPSKLNSHKLWSQLWLTFENISNSRRVKRLAPFPGGSLTPVRLIHPLTLESMERLRPLNASLGPEAPKKRQTREKFASDFISPAISSFRRSLALYACQILQSAILLLRIAI
jgi:hypothetical protein